MAKPEFVMLRRLYLAALGEELSNKLEALSLLVVDMRSYAASIANRGRGGGTESKGTLGLGS